MREYIVIQVGQCGNQIGGNFWLKLLEEYGIPYGQPITENQLDENLKIKSLHDSVDSFFMNLNEGNILNYKSQLKARALLIDMECRTVEKFFQHPSSIYFDKQFVVKNHPGSGNNWAEAFHVHGNEFEDQIKNALRQMVENSNNIGAFILLLSMGGGTGSGLGSRILTYLGTMYPEVDIIVVPIFPTGTEDVITCPYNISLTSKYLTDYATYVFPVENRALLEISKNEPKPCTTLQEPLLPYNNMNSIVAKFLLHLTSAERYPNKSGETFEALSSLMVPFPGLKYLTASISPMHIDYSNKIKPRDSLRFHRSIFIDCCTKRNQLIQLDPFAFNTKMYAATLLGRGSFTTKEMEIFANELERKGKFKICNQTMISKITCGSIEFDLCPSMLGMFNTSSMESLFNDTLNKFKKLYGRRAHIHHYYNIPGFDESSFDEAKESLLFNINNYKYVFTYN